MRQWLGFDQRAERAGGDTRSAAAVLTNRPMGTSASGLQVMLAV